MTATYDQLEHTADLALRVRGEDLPRLFSNAARAMFEQLADIGHVEPSVERGVSVEGSDYESVLVNWLNELLYLHETKREVYSVFDVHELSTTNLRATVRGARSEHVYMIIKGATYHDLVISRKGGGFAVTIVFDI